MRAAVARSLMTLATCCLGYSRREWAQAMQAEFIEAGTAGQKLGFAAGCLIAAWREMPRHVEGRLILVDHALALGVLLPAAFLQFACAIGMTGGPGGVYGVLALVGENDPYLVNAQAGAVPILLVLWLLLGATHLRLAWALLDRDRDRVVQAGSLVAAAAITLVIMIAVLRLRGAFLGPVIGTMIVELAFVVVTSRLHERVSAESYPARLTA